MASDHPRTPRGFAIYATLTDVSGRTIRVQQSSLATEDAVWIFAGGHRPALPEKFRARLAGLSEQEVNELAAFLSPSPQLNAAQAAKVRDALSAFLAEMPADATGQGRDGGQPGTGEAVHGG